MRTQARQASERVARINSLDLFSLFFCRFARCDSAITRGETARERAKPGNFVPRKHQDTNRHRAGAVAHPLGRGSALCSPPCIGPAPCVSLGLFLSQSHGRTPAIGNNVEGIVLSQSAFSPVHESGSLASPV